MTTNLEPSRPKWRGLTLLLVALQLAACSPLKTINLISPRDGYRLFADIAYGDNPRQVMDIYIPDDAPPTAVLVFFYGGSWRGGNKNDYRFLAQTLTQRGLAVVVPDYRVYPEVRFPDFVHDGARAVAWVHGNLRRYADQPLPLFVGGHSAGAHIAAMINFDEQYLQAAGGNKSWIRGFIGLAGPYDFLPIKSRSTLEVFSPPASHPRSQPINYVDGDEAPALLIHGTRDTTVLPRNTRNLAARIRQRGGRVETLFLDGKKHVSPILAFTAALRGRSPMLTVIEGFIRGQAGRE